MGVVAAVAMPWREEIRNRTVEQVDVIAVAESADKLHRAAYLYLFVDRVFHGNPAPRRCQLLQKLADLLHQIAVEHRHLGLMPELRPIRQRHHQRLAGADAVIRCAVGDHISEAFDFIDFWKILQDQGFVIGGRNGSVLVAQALAYPRAQLRARLRRPAAARSNWLHDAGNPWQAFLLLLMLAA